MKAYVLSVKNGIVQIGDTVFQPYIGESFKANRKGLKREAKYICNDIPKSMAGARAALHMPEAGRIYLR